jgi:hypothetical protein
MCVEVYAANFWDDHGLSGSFEGTVKDSCVLVRAVSIQITLIYYLFIVSGLLIIKAYCNLEFD